MCHTGILALMTEIVYYHQLLWWKTAFECLGMGRSKQFICSWTQCVYSVGLGCNILQYIIMGVFVEDLLGQDVGLNTVKTFTEVSVFLSGPMRQLILRRYDRIYNNDSGISTITCKSHPSAKWSTDNYFRLLGLYRFVYYVKRMIRVGIEFGRDYPVSPFILLLQLSLLGSIGAGHKSVQIHHNGQIHVCHILVAKFWSIRR